MLLPAAAAGKVRFVTSFELGKLTPPNTGINRGKTGDKKRERENVTKCRKEKKRKKKRTKIKSKIR